MQFLLDGTVDAQSSSAVPGTGRGDVILNHSITEPSGGKGNDLIALDDGRATGGKGADVFLMLDVAFNAEVLDFAPGKDIVNLSVIAQFRDFVGNLSNDTDFDGDVDFADLTFQQVDATTVRVTAGFGITSFLLSNASGLTVASLAQAANFEFATATQYDYPFQGQPVAQVRGTNRGDVLFGLMEFGSALDPQRIEARGGDDLALGGGVSDVIRLGRGNDTAHGGRGDDTVEGQQGDDVVSGGGGTNVLTGGGGADVFVISVESAFDTVTDFASGDSIAVDLGPRSFGAGDLDYQQVNAATVRVGTPDGQTFDVVAADGSLTLAEVQAATSVGLMHDLLAPGVPVQFDV